MTERFNILWNSNETRLRRLTAETAVLRNGRPFDPVQYVALVNMLNTYPFATSWNLTVPQFAQLVGGPLQMGKRAQLQSKILERRNPELAMSLVNHTKVMLLALDAVVSSATLVRGAATATGLGLVAVDDVAIGAGSVAIITVGVLLLATLVASVVALGQVLTTAATYCLAAGCTTEEVVQITNAMADSAVRILSTNPLNSVAKPGGGLNDLIFWGGLLVVGSGVAYALWKAQGEPVPPRLQRALSGLGEGGYEPDTSRLKSLVAKGTREEDYIDTSEYDNMFVDEKPPLRNALVSKGPLTTMTPARNAAANAARNANVVTSASAPARNTAKNAPVAVSKNASANSPARNTTRKGRLVAILPPDESTTQSKYRAWEIACRAQGISKPSCSPLEEEQVQQVQTRVILPNLSASEMDRVAKALRGGGYSVKVEK